VEFSHLTTRVKRIGPGRQSRRDVLRQAGLGGVVAGVLTTVGARMGHAQAWEDLPPTAGPASGSQAIPPASFAGVTGGLPPFVYALEASAPTEYAAGAIRWATREQLPTLRGVAMAAQRLGAGGLRELHWHLNAHELNYCLAGEGRIGIFAPDGTSEIIDIRPGSITFIPNGYTHYIQNTGADELRLVIAFTDERPETTDLSQALPAIPTPLLAQTFGAPASDVPFLATRGDRVIVAQAGVVADAAAGTPVTAAPSSYGVTVDQLPVVSYAGGTVQTLNDQQIPRLTGITVFPLTAVPHGLREPHWHPNAGELNYCVSGRAQIGLVAPDGNVQTFAVEAGDIAFIPQNWFHYIANVGDEPLQFLIFFIVAAGRVQTINLSQTFESVPAGVLGASFDGDAAWIAALPKRGNVGIAPPVGQE
jgi:oxalate decarboxylase